jgi:hypothetical protein
MCMIRRYVDRTVLSLIVNRYTKVHVHVKEICGPDRFVPDCKQVYKSTCA